MSKNHDENKDLKLVSRIAKIDYSNKSIQAPKSSVIGIRTWGRIDYLTHYCGWVFIWNNNVSVKAYNNDMSNSDMAKRKREAKKAAKEQTLSNKKKR